MPRESTTTSKALRTAASRLRRRSPRAAGLSLVEILVSLAILVVIGAVVVPWSIQWLGGRELDNAEDQLAMQMMMARAAAREEGRPVEVVATGASGVEARWMQADELLDDAADDGDARSGRASEDDPDGRGLASIRAQWALLDLPAGVRIELGAGDARVESARAESDASGERIDAAAPQTLAIFLPDGTAILAPIFMLRTDGGMARAMRVDRATGRPREVPGAVSRPFRSSADPFRDRLGESSGDDADETSGGSDPLDRSLDDATDDARGGARRGVR